MFCVFLWRMGGLVSICGVAGSLSRILMNQLGV